MKNVTIRFFDCIRGEKKFNGIEELKEQLERDRERSLEVIGAS
ncbi:MAG: hypothetical protein JJ971_09680 [Balneolaceae bacterium]|nr:hypothetical protein [Balneolaceae bacterium]MBO6546484.1 hypothetical protein [Balneolaceae bacterium]MBO6648843.1 hypothetical protein [Balneolaceae bacterium]